MYSYLLMYTLKAALFVGFIPVITWAICISDDLAIMQSRIVESYTQRGSSDAQVKILQKSVIAQAQSLLALQHGDGSFPDLNYGTTPSIEWPVATHFQRLLIMAQSYYVKDSPVHTPATVTAISDGLNYGANYYYPTTDSRCCHGNWWWWQIGVPQYLGPTLLLMQTKSHSTCGGVIAGLASAQVRTFEENMVGHVQGDASLMQSGGENAVWIAYGHLWESIITNQAIDSNIAVAIRNSCEVNDAVRKDGPKSDGSYQFHAGQLYNGGYGNDWVYDMVMFMSWSAGTALDTTTACIATTADVMLNGSAWMIYNGYWDPSTMSRYVDRPWCGPASTIRDAAARACNMNSAYAASFRSLAKQLTDVLGQSSDLASAADVNEIYQASKALSGHVMYATSDYSVHRRSNYFVGIKMFSTRVENGEGGIEDGHGQRQCDGRTYMSTSGTELWFPNVNPSLDWTRLPGITTEIDIAPSYGLSTQSFVGGTTNDKNGVTAMRYVATGKGTVKAQKAWFTFDDYMVATGNSIYSNSISEIDTVIDQTALSPGFTVNVDGMNRPYPFSTSFAGGMPHHVSVSNHLAYYVPADNDDLIIVGQHRSADWSSIGYYRGPTSGSFLIVYLNHGVKVKNKSYVYAVGFPGSNGNPNYSLLANTAFVTAVSSGAEVGIVFWQSGRALTVSPGVSLSSDEPCVVWLTYGARNKDVLIHAADPNQGTSSITLTLTQGKSVISYNRAVVISISKDKTTMIFPGTSGATFYAHIYI